MLSIHRIVFAVCLFLVPLAASAETIIPRVTIPPVLDGKLDDACWQQAVVIKGFSRNSSKDPAPKATEVRVCLTEDAFYFGFTNTEEEPDKIRTEEPEGSSDLWTDDCVEIFIRSTADNNEYFQFIANAAGKRRPIRVLPRVQGAYKPEWTVKTRIGEKAWFAEIKIPLGDVDVKQLRRGDMLQMKIGREGRAGKAGGHAQIWPAGARYGGPWDFTPVYIEGTNLLTNPEMVLTDDGRLGGWSIDAKDIGMIKAQTDGFIFDAPGRYATVSQTIRVVPEGRYALEAEVRAEAGIYFRGRVALEKGATTIPFTANIKPGKDWQPVKVLFPGSPTGKVLVIIGNTESGGKGKIHVRNLRATRIVSFESFGDPIPVLPGRLLVLRDIPVLEVRALRGKVGGTVDGMLDTRGWNAGVWEYRSTRNNTGVVYHHRDNDGLHVKLLDNEPFNALVIRGGVHADMYTGCKIYDSPEGGKLLHAFPGGTRNSRFFRVDPVKAEKISFFNVSDGAIADMSFLRILPRVDGLGTPLRMNIEGAGGFDEFRALAGRRFKNDKQIYSLSPVGRKDPMQLKIEDPGTAHLLCGPFPDDMSISAIGLDFTVGNIPAGAAFSMRVQDPVDSRRELAGADFTFSEPGALRLVLDVSDRIIPAGKTVWITLEFPAGTVLSGTAGRQVGVDLYTVSRAEAMTECLRDSKELLRNYFANCSEARPWNGWRNYATMEKSFKEGPFAFQLKQIMDQLDYCRFLAEDDPIIKQYYEWIMRSNSEWKKANKRWHALDSSHAKVDEIPGAPEWAIVARQAWLESRKVPQWWLDNRLIRTGEFGGHVNDDTCMNQNYINFPAFERTGTAAQLMAGAANLMKTAERLTLEKGLNSHTMDPLHAYEEGLNHMYLMWFWNWGDPVYFEKLLQSAKSALKLTVVTDKGHRHFKSQTVGSADLRMDRKWDQDGHAHFLMMNPAFEVLRYNGNPQLEKLLRQWLDGWLEHFEPDKYAVMVDVKKEEVTETTNRPLYAGYGAGGSALASLYLATGDEKYLGPFFDQYKEGRNNTSPGNMLPELYHLHGFKGLEKRDVLLKRNAFTTYYETGDKAPLIDILKKDIAEIQNYGYLYKAAELFTDRVFLYAIINPTIAYTGGYATRNKYNRTHAVSYQGLGTDYAALVKKAGRDGLHVMLYNFADKPLNGEMSLWWLDHGMYEVQQGLDSDADDSIDNEVVTGQSIIREIELQRGSALKLTLAPKQVTVITIKQTKKLDDIRQHADLALSASQVKVKRGDVFAKVHNIGAQAADVKIALIDAAGNILLEKALGNLKAPVDLEPKIVSFKLGPLPADAKDVYLVVDPDNKIPEIYEGNNKVKVDLTDTAAAPGKRAVEESRMPR